MNRSTLPLLSVLVLLTLAACSDRDEGDARLCIVPTISTRVTSLNFDTGDRIGLTVTRASGTYATNEPLTYDGTAFTAAGLCWYGERNEPATLTAYYPYAASGVPETFAVATDQRNGYAASDLLAACKSDVLPTSAPIGMTFYHLMAQLSIVVTNTSGSAVTEILIGGFVPTAAVDFKNLKAEASGTATAEITACAVKADANYRAILVPQQRDMEVRVRTADGKTYDRTITSVRLAGGKSYDLSLRLTAESLELQIGGEISDWLPGGEIGGDEPSVDPDPEEPTPDNPDDPDPTPGEEGTLTYEGESYRTRTIGGKVWMAENLRYLPAGAVIGTDVWEPTAGSVEQYGLYYMRATALALDNPSKAVTGTVRGICPEGWHVPSGDELRTLIGADCGTDFFALAGRFRLGSYNAGKDYWWSTDIADDLFVCLTYSASSGVAVSSGASNTIADTACSLRCVRD